MSATDTTPAAPAVSEYNPEGTEAIDAEALGAATKAIRSGIRSGVALFGKVEGITHLISYRIMQARLAITMANGEPDFGGVSAAYKETVDALWGELAGTLDKVRLGKVRSAVSTELNRTWIEWGITTWASSNLSTFPGKAKWTEGADSAEDLDKGAKPSLVVVTPEISEVVTPLYAHAELKLPEKFGGAGKAGRGTGAGPGAAKLPSLAALTTSAAALVSSKDKDQGATIVAALESSFEMLTATFEAALPSRGVRWGNKDQAAELAKNIGMLAYAIGKHAEGKLPVEDRDDVPRFTREEV